MRVIKNVLKWILALPFTVLDYAFMLLSCLSPILSKLSILFAFILIVTRSFKLLLESGAYGLFAAYVGILLAMLFSGVIFQFLSEMCRRISFKIRYGTPLNDPIYNQTQVQSNYSKRNQGDQKIILTVDQLRELLNKKE